MKVLDDPGDGDATHIHAQIPVAPLLRRRSCGERHHSAFAQLCPSLLLPQDRAKRRVAARLRPNKTLAGLLGDDADRWCGRTIILAPAVAPNRKATIAVGTPKREPAGTEDAEEPEGSASPDDACETCGGVGAHHPNCPEA